MKKLLIIIFVFLLSFEFVLANYKLETWSKNFVKNYEINTNNLEKPITRKEFVEILYKWYPDYKKDRWIIVDMSKYDILDNSIIFKDIDLNSDFGKKLSYFTNLWSFSKKKYFYPNWILWQKDFFTVMKRLKILFWLQNCKYHKICEKESDNETLFLKWTYIKYVSKIMNKDLRKYYSKPQDYINAWYKPYLLPNYHFPLKKQTLNWCYAFSIRNILKYKHWIWVYISKIEKSIWKNPISLWTYFMMNKFDNYAHIYKKKYYNIDTLISSLQVWEPVAISYMLDYFSYKNNRYKKVPHVVAAYSFDENWVWVAETVSNTRKLIKWKNVFNKNWYVALNRIFKYYYNPKYTWSKNDLILEKNYNYLVWEH